MLAAAAACALALGAPGCGDDGNGIESNKGNGVRGATGEIRIDGAQPVGEITQAVADSYGERNPGVEITVGLSGNDSGFERLCAGETAIHDSAWPIEPEVEDLCAEDNIVPEEIMVAHEGVVVVVNRENPAECVSATQLAEIWGEDAVSTWSEVTGLGPEFDAEIERFGPPGGSRPFDYFTDAIGDEGAQTRDYSDSEEDSVILAGVAESQGAIGYLDLTSYLRGPQRPRRVKALRIENEKQKCVKPSVAAVQNQDYNPFGRPLYLYAAYDEARSQPVSSFLAHYVENADRIARELGFIPLTEPQLRASADTVARITGAKPR